MNTPKHIERKLQILKNNDRERIAQEIEKQIFLTLNKWWALFHIDRILTEEIDKIPNRQLELEFPEDDDDLIINAIVN